MFVLLLKIIFSLIKRSLFTQTKVVWSQNPLCLLNQSCYVRWFYFINTKKTKLLLHSLSAGIDTSVCLQPKSKFVFFFFRKKEGLLSNSPCWVTLRSLHLFHFDESISSFRQLLIRDHSLDLNGLKCWRSYDRALFANVQGTSSGMNWIIPKARQKAIRENSNERWGIYTKIDPLTMWYWIDIS